MFWKINTSCYNLTLRAFIGWKWRIMSSSGTCWKKSRSRNVTKQSFKYSSPILCPSCMLRNIIAINYRLQFLFSSTPHWFQIYPQISSSFKDLQPKSQNYVCNKSINRSILNFSQSIGGQDWNTNCKDSNLLTFFSMAVGVGLGSSPSSAFSCCSCSPGCGTSGSKRGAGNKGAMAGVGLGVREREEEPGQRRRPAAEVEHRRSSVAAPARPRRVAVPCPRRLAWAPPPLLMPSNSRFLFSFFLEAIPIRRVGGTEAEREGIQG